MIVTRDKQDKIDALLNSRDDIPELRSMIRDFSRKMEQIDPKTLSMEEGEKVNAIKQMIASESI